MRAMEDGPAYLTARPVVHTSRLWTQYWYANKQLDRLVSTMLDASRLPSDASVVDYGCAQQPYRKLFPETATYVGADLPGNDAASMTIQPDGTLPCPDASFDAVLSTQVLEHVVDPDLYLRECARVLKPGGSLLLTTHGLMYYHRDPEDYWRWTIDGLTMIVARAGLEVAEQHGGIGLTAGAVQIFQDATAHRVPRFLRSPYFLVLQVLMHLFDRRQTPKTLAEYGMLVSVRATRPAAVA